MRGIIYGLAFANLRRRPIKRRARGAPDKAKAKMRRAYNEHQTEAARFLLTII